MNALYINGRHLSNQLDIASVTEACLMSLSSTEYAFFSPPDTRRIYLTVSDCTALPFFPAFSCDDSFACLSPRAQTGDFDASSFRIFLRGKLETFVTHFAKSKFFFCWRFWHDSVAGSSCRASRFCSAAICIRTSR